jgi:acyl-CoA synthetase (AMP-forming)/AMP-acid ligase II
VRHSEILDEATVLKYCEKKLAQSKLPKPLRFIDQIPWNASDKAPKAVLREQIATGVICEQR